MTRAFDFTVAVVVSLISVIIHRISIELFAPGSTLYGIATDATHFQASSRAWLWSQILIVWAPLLVITGVWAWVFTREYRRQVATTAVASRRPP